MHWNWDLRVNVKTGLSQGDLQSLLIHALKKPASKFVVNLEEYADYLL